jgi:hypothetical protein
MNMKRGLVLSLAALALVVGNAPAKAADIDLSLNLRYTHPANPSLGGQWFLMAKTNTAGANTGIAGLSVYLSNISPTGIVWGNGTAVGTGAQTYPVVTQTTLGANVSATGNVPFNFSAGGVTNIVYGQDLVTKTLTIGEGAATPGVLAADPLRNTTWANSTLIMSGTFAGGGNAGNKFNRPNFVPSGANSTDGNVYNASGVAIDASVSTIVRGDSVIPLGLNTPATGGLLRGDTDRNGTVSLGLDIIPVVGGLNAPGGWAQGDFDGNGTVSLGLDIVPNLGNLNQTGPAPISAVPEPASASLAVMALLGMVACARRKFDF